MKKYLLISFLTLNVLGGYAQQKVTVHSGSASIDSGATYTQHISDSSSSIPIDGGQKETFQFVQEMPKFPGGDMELINYIQNHINHSVVSPQIHGKIIVRFIVDENGNVQKPNIPKGKGIGGGCDEEAIRVIMSLPKWTPGKQNGHDVAVWFSVPVTF